ncbi:multicopper oxidase family protein [Falsiroseomonas tokyonensis]|uniref:Multicopper oxidase family protein n=1 Tax=Falsiroseomonas tokyonensis TaxID=430521 RepID=A0ABV7C566_9PROT|nr:multicopper oxidase family protein [Falsiroseomonas tokyonensis]MBU8541806.1 multicopper oxidase family protein [Falsiroseomonas tokyonensis]
MPISRLPMLGRRFLMLGGAAAFSATGLRPVPAVARAADSAVSGGSTIRLIARPGRAALAGPPHSEPETTVWGYDGRVPGPEIRVRQGERLRVVLENRLPEETTIHWHGLRVPNAMDGVPHLTQPPIAPGESFAYEFDATDAGTYWYHPHVRSFEQVERGLYGPLVIEERELPRTIDRDVTWVLDDWRLLEDAQIAGGFGNAMEAGMTGRVGNTVTVNGRVTDGGFAVRSGERLRLRLVNAANARIFGLVFEGHEPVVVALDGQPVTPHAPEDGRVVVGPGMRVDLVLDMTGRPGARARVLDTYYAKLEYRLLEIAYGAEPLRDRPPTAPIPTLPANPVPEPNLARAERHAVVLGGGMMNHLEGALVDGRWLDAREMMRRGLIWTVNGTAAAPGVHVHEPLAVLRRGASYLLEIRNETAWPHPMHLHGHSFRVIARNGVPTRHREWQDTVLIPRRESVEIAFVADNPGDWMFHCHVLEHQAAGMMGLVRVA